MAILHEVEIGVRDALQRRGLMCSITRSPDRREAIMAAVRLARAGRHGAYRRERA